jgi:hypothetical protein
MSSRFGSTIGKVTEDDEMWTTVTERENDVAASYREIVSATKYYIHVDLDGDDFPHVIQGQSTNRLDITSLYIALDLAANSKGALQFGVITRVDGTNADISYFFDAPFISGAAEGTLLYSLRGVPSQVKSDLMDGVPQHWISNIAESDVVAVNTGVALDSPKGAGTVTPGVGDLIVKAEVGAGSYAFTLGAFYHGH